MKKRVLIVGSAENSAGGVSSVIKLMKKMPVWEEFECYWLGTQIQRNYFWKFWYAVKANVIALFIIWRYDIVHFHTVPDKICLIIQLPIFILSLIGKKKVIMHLHIGNQLEREKERNLSIFRWCMKKSNVVVVLSNHLRDILVKKYSDIKTKKIVLYNACEDVTPISYEMHDKTILFAGAINKNKACDLLIDAFKSVHDEFGDWKLQLLGCGPLESECKSKVMSLGLSEFVEFTGYLEGTEKQAYFKKAGIYAMCSFLEGFPMVVLEAWAYGVPVVSTPVGGLVDVLEDGKNAYVFNFGNVEELSSQIKKMIKNSEHRRLMSEYCKVFVADNFSKQIINRQIENLYAELS